MDTRKLRENRSLLPATELARYRGQWVAFSMDGRRIVASARGLAELDALLVELGEDPEKVALEFLDSEDSYLGGAETVCCYRLRESRVQ
jgi:hypothetical protein